MNFIYNSLTTQIKEFMDILNEFLPHLKSIELDDEVYTSMA